MKILTAALAAALLAGCAGRVSDAYPIPPPLPLESRPLPPVSDNLLSWRPGDWAFLSGSYRYEAGQWVEAAGHSGTWQFGHWAGPRDQAVWVPGHWL